MLDRLTPGRIPGPCLRAAEPQRWIRQGLEAEGTGYNSRRKSAHMRAWMQNHFGRRQEDFGKQGYFRDSWPLYLVVVAVVVVVSVWWTWRWWDVRGSMIRNGNSAAVLTRARLREPPSTNHRPLLGDLMTQQISTASTPVFV
jgi:hypothetical protein